MTVNVTAERTIYGSFGKLTDQDGAWLANATKVEYKVVIDKKDIKLQGTRKTGYKMTGVRGEGTITGFKVTSAFLLRVSTPMRDDRSAQFVGSLYVKLDDPESYGTEHVLLTGVKFWEVNGGFQVDQVVEESIPFTFYDVLLLSTIPS